MSARPVKVVGLAGGVAAGKSTVAALMAQMGAAVVDADRIGHEALEEVPVRKRLRERWGDALFGPDGRVDRGRLGRIVFDDEEAREFLNSLVHPRIRRQMRKQIHDLRRQGGHRLIVVDAALLLEAGLEGWCDEMVFVDAPARMRDARARADRGWSATERARREATQMTPREKRAKCRLVVVNNGSMEDLRRRVRDLIEIIGS